MRTDDLIARLAAEPVAPRPGAGRWLALAAGLVATAALFAAAYGVRPDLGRVAADPAVAAKTLLPLALAGLAFVLALRACRPGARPGAEARAIWAVPALTAALVAGTFLATPPDVRLAVALGHSIHVCLPSIALLAAPILAGLLAALRHGAPERPARAGALAGFAAAGVATVLYSVFCTEDSPLFYGLWYSLGILIVALAGAVAGARVLRW
jgi:hypothetical protein